MSNGDQSASRDHLVGRLSVDHGVVRGREREKSVCRVAGTERTTYMSDPGGVHSLLKLGMKLRREDDDAGAVPEQLWNAPSRNIPPAHHQGQAARQGMH